MSTTDDKRTQSVDSVKTSAFEANEQITHWKDEIKRKILTKLQKRNYANIT